MAQHETTVILHDKQLRNQFITSKLKKCLSCVNNEKVILGNYSKSVNKTCQYVIHEYK